MAEKYGVIPKKFTGEWFDYVWTYYKWHMIIPIAVIIFTVVTIYQCTHRTKYDADVIYAGKTVFSDAQMKEIPLGMAQYCDNIDGDDETRVSFQQINFSRTAGTEEMDYNLQMKLDLQFQSNNAYIFLFDKEEADLMIGREEENLIYSPVEDWATSMPSEDKLYMKNGKAYAVSLAENEVIKQLGIKTEDLYLVLRLNNSDDEESEARYTNAKKLANGLIGN